MKLSDIMSASGLSGFAEVALLLFMGVFVAICISVLSKKNAKRLEEASRIPLEDSKVSCPRKGETSDSASSDSPTSPS